MNFPNITSKPGSRELPRFIRDMKTRPTVAVGSWLADSVTNFSTVAASPPADPEPEIPARIQACQDQGCGMKAPKKIAGKATQSRRLALVRLADLTPYRLGMRGLTDIPRRAKALAQGWATKERTPVIQAEDTAQFKINYLLRAARARGLGVKPKDDKELIDAYLPAPSILGCGTGRELRGRCTQRGMWLRSSRTRTEMDRHRRKLKKRDELERKKAVAQAQLLIRRKA